MKRSRKSNNVSWAPGASLGQVQLFLRDDCPSQVGPQRQNHHKVKASLVLPSSGMRPNNLPPGFEGSRYVARLKRELSHIPQIKWKCPPKFVMSCNWLVASGEESEEVEVQKLREMKASEVVYPDRSAIPPCPFVSLDIGNEQYDDSQTPLVPLTPIEDEEIENVSSDLVAQTKIPVRPQAQALPQGLSVSRTPNTSKCNAAPLEPPSSQKSAHGMKPGLGANVIVAASDAITTLMKSKELESLLDADLLVKILIDPKMVEKLINDHGAPVKNLSAPASAPTAPTVASPPVTGSAPLPGPDTVSVPMVASQPIPGKGMCTNAVGAPRMVSSQTVTGSVPFPCTKPAVVLSPVPANRSLYHAPNGVQPKGSATPQLDTFPHSEFRRVEPSVPFSTSEPSNVLAPRLPNGNFHCIPKPVQPASGLMPAQPNPVQNFQPTFSTFPAQPNSVPLPTSEPCNVFVPRLANGNFHCIQKPVHLASGLMPAQPNPVQKFQPTFGTLPAQPNSVPTFAANPLKDVSYIKNLIREHGAVRQEMIPDHNISQTGNYHNHIQNLNVFQNLKPGEKLKTKIQKPCVYFRSSKGCRNGANCPYQHDVSFQWRTGSVLEALSAKRMKFGEEIAGRT